MKIKEKLTEALSGYGEPGRIESKVNEILAIVKMYNMTDQCQCNGPWNVVHICKICNLPQPHLFFNHSETRNKLRKIRINKNIESRKAAWAIGVHPATLSNWESGRGSMNKERVKRYSEFLETK